MEQVFDNDINENLAPEPLFSVEKNAAPVYSQGRKPMVLPGKYEGIFRLNTRKENYPDGYGAIQKKDGTVSEHGKVFITFEPVRLIAPIVKGMHFADISKESYQGRRVFTDVTTMETNGTVGAAQLLSALGYPQDQLLALAQHGTRLDLINVLGAVLAQAGQTGIYAAAKVEWQASDKTSGKWKLKAKGAWMFDRVEVDGQLTELLETYTDPNSAEVYQGETKLVEFGIVENPPSLTAPQASSPYNQQRAVLAATGTEGPTFIDDDIPF